MTHYEDISRVQSDHRVATLLVGYDREKKQRFQDYVALGAGLAVLAIWIVARTWR
jgi:hypothetical protein